MTLNFKLSYVTIEAFYFLYCVRFKSRF